MATGVSGRSVDLLLVREYLASGENYCDLYLFVCVDQAVFWISGLVHIIGSLLFLFKGEKDQNPGNSFSIEGSDQIQSWAKQQQPLT